MELRHLANGQNTLWHLKIILNLWHGDHDKLGNFHFSSTIESFYRHLMGVYCFENLTVCDFRVNIGLCLGWDEIGVRTFLWLV